MRVWSVVLLGFGCIGVGWLGVGCGGSASSSAPATGAAAPHAFATAHGDADDAATSSAAPPSPMQSIPPSAPPSPPSTGSSSDAPSPSVVCAHVAQIMASELAAAGVPSTGGNDPECVKKAEGERSSDPKGYACDARCIMAAKDFAGIQACSGKCPSK